MTLTRQSITGLTRKRVLKYLGTTETQREPVLALVKSRMVLARQNGDDALAATYSEIKTFVKRTFRGSCSVCGVTIFPGSQRCSAHRINSHVRTGAQ